ncbi:MAG TPA: sigma-70 family RNA polymerase sigma factor, partial [Clostridia bacterium]|nr:sigma-70 family RNA polymerase sigma factor [Clostridia bacterium]
MRGVIGLSTVDEVLIQRCRNGDLDAFEQIMETYKQKVYNLAYRMTGNAADASDLSQEVFLRVYRSLDNFRGDSSFS